MRGVFFKVPNEYGNILEKILQNIDLNKYSWCVNEEESWIANGDFIKDLFEKRLYNGIELYKVISGEEHYISFVNITAFPLHSEIKPFKDYKEYEESDCQMAIFITDTTFIEIYCKNPDELSVIQNNAIANGYTDIEDTTDESDGRTRFYIFG